MNFDQDDIDRLVKKGAKVLVPSSTEPKEQPMDKIVRLLNKIFLKKAMETTPPAITVQPAPVTVEKPRAWRFEVTYPNGEKTIITATSIQ